MDSKAVFLHDRRFTPELQEAFSRLSGDCNPMHTDPVFARRTMAGGQVVHGIHQALAALEAALGHLSGDGRAPRAITELKGIFLKPVLVGETIDFYLTDGGEVLGRLKEETVCRFSISYGETPVAVNVEIPGLTAERPADLRFDELAGRAGSLALGLDTAQARQMFPLTTQFLAPIGIAEVLGLSRLVGMRCPGLHSLFSQFAARFGGAGAGNALNFRVDKTDERFGKVVMAVNGPGMEGEVTAFFRPPPEQQPGMAEAKALVEPGTFAGSVALIVGGSRGLGEITARLIAAGGGLPVITYYQGADDARRVADSIHSAGGRCEVMHLDMRHAESAIPRFFTDREMPRSIYYFATPKIFGRRRGFFDHDLLREFQDVYVTAFGRLVDEVAINSSEKLRVFYPSSVAVEETMRELAEYAMAKRMGEELCAFYNRYAEQIEIIVERLPRIRTDQTSTLLPVPAADALEVMLPIVRRMESPPTPSGAA